MEIYFKYGNMDDMRYKICFIQDSIKQYARNKQLIKKKKKAIYSESKKNSCKNKRNYSVVHKYVTVDVLIVVSNCVSVNILKA